MPYWSKPHPGRISIIEWHKGTCKKCEEELEGGETLSEVFWQASEHDRLMHGVEEKYDEDGEVIASASSFMFNRVFIEEINPRWWIDRRVLPWWMYLCGMISGLFLGYGWGSM